MFERVIAGLDVATGEVDASCEYKTVGPSSSTFVEGNSTIQFDVLNSTATYNTTTNAPNPPEEMMRKRRRMMMMPRHSGRLFKPVKH